MALPKFIYTLLFLATISRLGDSRALGISNICNYESCVNNTLGTPPANNTSTSPSTDHTPSNSSSDIPLGFVNITNGLSTPSNDSTSDSSSSNMTLGFVYINNTSADLRHRSTNIIKSIVASLAARSSITLRQYQSDLKARIAPFRVPDVPEPVVPVRPDPDETGGTSENPGNPQPYNPDNPIPFRPTPTVRPSPSPTPEKTDNPLESLSLPDASSSSDQPSPTPPSDTAYDPGLGHITITSSSSASASTEATCNAS